MSYVASFEWEACLPCTRGYLEGLLARYGEASMLKSFKLMVNLVLIGIAIGRTYTIWQQRFTSVKHLR